jgi:Domain of unknown function (DUF222)
MRQDPFPDPGEDDQEPDGFPPADDEAGQQQGLFLCLPAGQFDPDQFAESGLAADMPPGALMATLMDAIAGEGGSGLPGLSDDQLIGFIVAALRMQSRDAWYAMAAMREWAVRAANRGPLGQFAADELANELNSTWLSAAGEMEYARNVAERLPQTFAALAEGRLDAFRVRIIEEETRILSAEDAAKADAELAEAAGSLTYGKLRSAARRMVLELDPEAVQRRKDAARRNPEVRRFREESGNTGMIAREMPTAEATASWQHLEQRALDLRAAGMPGTLEELRIRALLDLLQGRDSRDGLPSQEGPDPSPEDEADKTSSARQPAQDPGSTLAAAVNITVPWSASQGQPGTGAEMDGFGLVDSEDTRDLLAAAARDPRTRWCVTLLNPDGTAAAHGCAHGRHPPPGTGPPQDWLRHLRIRLTPITRGQCHHEQAETAYRPSRHLQHIVKARNARCTAPGCGRPAAKCDLDHTIAWDKGGLTCECDLAPLCRHHHRAKQAQGWRLEQPEPGVLIWHTPSGRSYTTTPTRYPL